MSGGIVSGEREISHDALMARVARAASGFAGLGIGENDAVALLLRNDFAFLEAAMAAPAVGAYAVPINWHFTAEEVGYILADCGAKALVAHADLLPAIAAAIPEGVHVFAVPTPPEIRAAYSLSEEAVEARSWDQFIEAQEPWASAPIGARDSMIYTSGTTGRPKGVRRQPPGAEGAERMAAMVSTVFDIRPGGGMRTVVTGPMYHSAPNAYGLWAARDGGFVVLQPRFEPQELLALIERHRISHLHMVPTMFVRLLKLPEEVRLRHDLSSLRFVVHAAAPCPPDVKRRMIEWWGPVINEYYGATETGAVVFHTSEEALAKPGTVGRPIEGGEVRIVGEDGKALPAGEIGEVYLRLHGLSDFTYHGDADKRAEIDLDGLVSVGDLGYLDEDGYLFLRDRKNHMVISGGVNIYPAEIENALVAMPGVRDCAVFGIPDEEFGESLCAYVEPEPGFEPGAEEVRAFLRQHLAAYKVPRVVEFRHELPREDSGKIFKRKLREPYWAQSGRRI